MENKNITILSQYAQSNLSKVVFSLLGIILLSISSKIGLNVDIQNNKRNKGKISFEYKDLNQLNKIIQIIKNNY